MTKQIPIREPDFIFGEIKGWNENDDVVMFLPDMGCGHEASISGTLSETVTLEYLHQRLLNDVVEHKSLC
jgi:hypothetical protein